MKNMFFLALVVVSFGMAGIVYAGPNLDDFYGDRKGGGEGKGVDLGGRPCLKKKKSMSSHA